MCSWLSEDQISVSWSRRFLVRDGSVCLATSDLRTILIATTPPEGEEARLMVENPPRPMTGPRIKPATDSPSSSGMRVGCIGGVNAAKNSAAGEIFAS